MVQKIGRNDSCPCGSGKKYKRCCLNNEEVGGDISQSKKLSIGRLALMRFGENFKRFPDLLKKTAKEFNKIHPAKNFERYIRERWDIEKVGMMRTEAIVKKLKSMNVDFQEKTFKQQVYGHISAIEVSEKYYYTQDHHAEGPDEDFIWLAICELWRRLIPEQANIEMIDEAMQGGYKDIEKNNYKSGMQKWETAWDLIKKVVPKNITSVMEADEFMPEPLTQLIVNWCQDFEMELHNAGIEGEAYITKRIKYCREFYEWFPNTKDSILQNMFHAEAESYAMLGNIEMAEKLYKAMIEKFSGSVSGYIGLGDMYFHQGHFEKISMDYDKAERFYREGLSRCNDELGKEIIYERLEDLVEEKNSRGKGLN